MDLLDRVSAAVTAAAETVSGPIWNQIWNQTAPKSQIGRSGDAEVPDKIGGPSRTRTLDPLIKSEDLERYKSSDEHESTGTYDGPDDREHRLRTDESPHVGTNLEPDPSIALRVAARHGSRLDSARRSVAHPVTYSDIRAWVYSNHGFSPRTGWIAHVKELSGLKVRATHNRRDSSRVDFCPPERRGAIEEALRHFRIL